MVNREIRQRTERPLARQRLHRMDAGQRKVRAPQGRVVGNAHRPQGPGKCNRKQTATGTVRKDRPW